MTPPRASEYRDDTNAARERIAKLEAMVAERGGPPSEPDVVVRRVVGLLVVALLSLALGVAVAWVRALSFELPLYTVVRPPAAAPEPAPLRNLSWLEPSLMWTAHEGPWLADVDGKPAVVGLLWRRGLRRNGLHVAAFDRATLSPLWVAGPFPSEWVGARSDRYNVLVKDDVVLVADAAGLVRFLELRSGRELGTSSLRRGVTGGCIAADGSGRVVLGFSAFRDPVTNRALFSLDDAALQTFFVDPATRLVTPAPLASYCSLSGYCSKTLKDACKPLDPTRREIEKANVDHWRWGETWRHGPRRLEIGTDDEHAPVAAVFLDGNVPQWRTSLESASRPALRNASTISPAHQGARSVLSARGLVYGYATQAGPYHLVLLDEWTGDRRFDVDLPGTGFATRVAALVADGNDLFAVVDDELLVIDATNGQVRGHLEAP